MSLQKVVTQRGLRQGLHGRGRFFLTLSLLVTALGPLALTFSQRTTPAGP